jgi:L-ascorbate metabolism protein UlaG (beta-lactamase superfamily)
MTQGQRTEIFPRTSAFGRWAAIATLTLGLLGCNGGDDTLKMTWFGISNWSLEVGKLNMVIDGYMTRIPANYFSGGGGGLALTKKGFPIDKTLVDKMHGVLAGSNPVKYLFTGHSHFDHSFDTPYWATATGAPVMGSQSTCFQTQAMGVPKEQCTPMFGGESIVLNDTVTVRVVLWNHSGTHEQNPEQHDAVELRAPPMPDSDGNLRGGVAEDFPNGGGNRGYLFTIKTAGKPINMFFTNSGSTQDLQLDTVVDGKNYGSPLQSLANAMREAGATSVDVWIGGGGEGVARYVVPILRPAVYIPNHLGDFFQKFEAGYDNGPYRDPALKKYLDSVGVTLLAPIQYLDRFDVDHAGTRLVPNREQKMVFGFTDIPVPRDAGMDAPADGHGDVAISDGSPDDGSGDLTDAASPLDAVDGGDATDEHDVAVAP